MQIELNNIFACSLAVAMRTKALFSKKKLDFGTVAFSFLFNKHCPIMD